MRPEDVDFLRVYLQETKEFEGRVRLEGFPAVKERGRWRRIVGLRPSSRGLELRIQGSKGKLLLAPRDRLSEVRREASRRLVQAFCSLFRGYRILEAKDSTHRLEHQAAGLLRLKMAKGRRREAVLVAFPDEPARFKDRVVAAMVLWWEKLRKEAPGPRFPRLFVPSAWTRRIVQSLVHLRFPVRCYLYEMRPGGELDVEQIYPSKPRHARVRSPYLIYPSPGPAPAPLRRIVERHPDLDLGIRHGAWEVCCLGLPVAWQDRVSRECRFDVTGPASLLGAGCDAFEAHLAQVRRLRSFPPRRPAHLFYRYHPERWLESLLRADHRKINRGFQDVLYSQVPSHLDGDRKVLDLVTATDEGRLAVLELKVEKSLELVFQALDYWERVQTHLDRGDFHRQGYFRGMQLRAEPPLLYLVAPLFEFHRTFPLMRRHLNRGVRFECLGVNTDWRRGIKILRRFRF